MSRSLQFAALAFLIAAGCAPEPKSLSDGSHATFDVGQEWKYRTRPQEPDSRLIILKLESNPEIGTIAHLAVSKVAMGRPGDGPSGIDIEHMPIKIEALENSVTGISEKSVPLPDYAEGYNTWRTAFERGDAGVFSLPVADSINAMEEAMSQHADTVTEETNQK